MVYNKTRINWKHKDNTIGFSRLFKAERQRSSQLEHIILTRISERFQKAGLVC